MAANIDDILATYTEEQKLSLVKSLLNDLSEPKLKTVINQASFLRREILKNSPWWAKYREHRIVFMDSEHVHLKHLSGRERIKCGTVCIVNTAGEQIYINTVRHAANFYLVNSHTRASNGFERDSLVNGSPIETVTEQVKNILKEKLVVVFGGENDFSCLNLDAFDFNVYDLQDYWRRLNGTAIKLKILENRFLPNESNVQCGVHSPYEDARVTAKLFSYYREHCHEPRNRRARVHIDVD